MFREARLQFAVVRADVYNKGTMSNPEISTEVAKNPEIKIHPEQFIVPETIQQIGVSAQQQTVNPLTDDSNQPLATPTDPDPTQTFHVLTVPSDIAHDPKELVAGAHGPANLSVTWLDMYWLREMQIALSKSWKVIFGK